MLNNILDLATSLLVTLSVVTPADVDPVTG